jgi:glycosyltransferase involved in cell wall biosynthesis
VRDSYDDLPVLRIRINGTAKGWEDDFTGRGRVLGKALMACLEEVQPDLVHLNGMKPVLNALCLEMGIPHVVTAHHPGVVCPAGALLTDRQELCTAQSERGICVPCCSKQRSKSRVAGTLLSILPRPLARNASALGTRPGRLGFIARSLAYPWGIERSLESKADLLHRAPLWIAPSHAIRDYLVLNGTLEERIRIIPHGIEPLERIVPEPFDGRPVRFGFMGSLGAAKGLHVLIRALTQMGAAANCELHVFAKAHRPWDQRYLDETMQGYAGKPPVIFHDPVSREALGTAYRQFDVLVVPSICMEAFGLVVLEAFSAGRPVIVSDSGGLRELVRDGVDGIRVERNSAQSLAKAMALLLEDRQSILSLAKHAPYVRTIQEHVEELESTYEAFVPKTGAGKPWAERPAQL